MPNSGLVRRALTDRVPNRAPTVGGGVGRRSRCWSGCWPTGGQQPTLLARGLQVLAGPLANTHQQSLVLAGAVGQHGQHEVPLVIISP